MIMSKVFPQILKVYRNLESCYTILLNIRTYISYTYTKPALLATESFLRKIQVYLYHINLIFQLVCAYSSDVRLAFGCVLFGQGCHVVTLLYVHIEDISLFKCIFMDASTLHKLLKINNTNVTSLQVNLCYSSQRMEVPNNGSPYRR